MTILDIKTSFEVGPATGIQVAAYEKAYEENPPELSDIIFNEEKHTYSQPNGLIIPSVTQIMRIAGLLDFSSVPQDRLEISMKFGTAVHLACEYFDKGILKFSTLDRKINPYLEAWMNFLKQTGFRITDIERIVYSKRYGYAGKLDRTGEMGGKKHQRLAVLLKPDSTFEITEYKDPGDFNIFISALNIYRWKNRK